MSEFQDLTFYDAPSVALNNFLDGEDFKTTFIDSGFNQSNLTPAQRYGLTESMKDKYGKENSAARALIGIATNPFTWMFLATGPAGVHASKFGKKLMGPISEQYGRKLIENKDLLSASHLLSSNQMTAGTATEDIVHAILKGRNDFIERNFNGVIQPSLQKTASAISQITAANIPTKDLLRSRFLPERTQELIKEVQYLLGARLNRRIGDSRTEDVVSLLRKEGDEYVDVQTIQINQPRLLRKETYLKRTEELKKQGIDIEELAVAHRESYDNAVSEMFLDEDSFRLYREGGYKDPSLVKVDDEKIKRMYGSLSSLGDRNLHFRDPLPSNTSATHMGDEAIKFIFGDDIVAGREAMQGLTPSQFKSFLDTTYVKPVVGRYYVPRNNFSPVLGEQRPVIGSMNDMVDDFSFPKLDTRKRADLERKFKTYNSQDDVDLLHRINFAMPKGTKQNVQVYHPDVYKYFMKLEQTHGQPMSGFTKYKGDEVPVDLINLIDGHDSALRQAASRNKIGKITAFDDMRIFDGTSKYMKGAGLQHTFHILGGGSLNHPVLRQIKTVMDANGKNWSKEVGKIPVRSTQTLGLDVGQTNIEGLKGGRRVEALDPRKVPPPAEQVTVSNFFDKKPDGGYSIADLLWRESSILKNRNDGAGYGYHLLHDIILPRAIGDLELHHATHMAAMLNSKMFLKNMGEGVFGKMLDKTNTKFGANLRQQMLDLGDPNVLQATTGRGAAGNVAKYLYNTHLGLNLSTVALQLTQPFLHLSNFVGVDNVLKAYGQAMKEYGTYMSARSRQNFRAISPLERKQLHANSFVHLKEDMVFDNVLGVGDNVYSLVDETMQAGQGVMSETKRTATYWLSQAPMKLFEKAEMFNRLVSAHAVDNFYKASGRFPRAFVQGSDDYYKRMSDIRSVVDETQFGGTYLNTASVFLGGGPLGRFAELPYTKQFLTFPVRSFTSLFATGKRVGEGKRYFRGTDVEVPLPTAAVDFLRMMGTSAILYEVGKEVFNADIERGLTMSAITDTFPDLTNQQDSIIPIPPIVDAPINVARGILSDDPSFTGLSLGRLLPSGVGITRILSSFEKIGSNTTSFQLPSALQRKFVDWEKPNQEGNYPIFTSDGRFIEFQSGTDIILNGLGLKTLSATEGGKLDGYLMKQRENIRNVRRKAIAALMSNDIERYMKLKERFESDFKNPDTGESIPLTFTKRQLKDYVKNLSVARTERILQGISPELRPIYQESIGGRAEALGVPREVITNADISTTTARNKYFNRPQNLNLDPQTIELIRGIIEESDREKQFSSPTFDSFGGFATQ